jgi:glycyl-tRNA synthetase beta chain
VPFLFERLRYVLEQRGYDVRNVRAVTHQTSLAEVKPVDARRKLEVLPEFTGSADFLKLATLFKRVRNIARELPDVEFSRIETGVTAVSSSAEEAAETQLREELEQRGPKIDAAVDGGENFRAAFDEAARFGPAVDRFFTDVLVMAKEPGLRLRRLALMKRLERTILRLADVSEIVKED